MMVIPESDFASAAQLDISNVSSSSFQQVSANRLDTQLRLSSSLLDINGDGLTLDKPYVLAFVVVKDNLEMINVSVGNFQLQDKNILLGKYVGGWNDNHFGDTRFSVNLNLENNGVSGPFYFLETFKSCCGGSDDGELKLVMQDDGTVTLRYSQELGTYRGVSPCNGVYTGEGRLQNNSTGLKLVYTLAII